MAFRAYTVDRQDRLAVGMSLDAVRYTDVHPAVLQEHVDAWFPRGVTQHGETYLLRSTSMTVFDSGTELICELVRRAEYPEAPSRFGSVFACETVEDARTFRAELGWDGAPIFEVETDREPFRADMRCLNIRNTILVSAYGARRYWSQQQTNIHVFPGAVPQSPFWELLLQPPVRVLRSV